MDGEIFGYAEIKDGTTRRATVYALHEAEVLYINKADFIKLSEHTDLVQWLYKYFPPFNFDIIGDKILKHDMLKK